MKKLLSLIIAIALACTLTSCMNDSGREDPNRQDSDDTQYAQSLDVLLLREVENELFIEIATYSTPGFHYLISDPESMGLSMDSVRLGRVTKEEHDEFTAMIYGMLERLRQIDYYNLNEDDKLLYSIMLDALELDYEYKDFYYYQEPFNIMRGIHVDMPVALTEYEFRKQSDIDDYLELIEIFKDYAEDCLEFELSKVAHGTSIPDRTIDAVKEQCAEFLKTKDDHDLISSFNDRVDAFEGLTDEQRQQYKARNLQVLNEYFFPVYERIPQVLEDLRGLGTNPDGVSYFENGREYYALELRNAASANFTPEQIIKMLDDAIAREIGIMETSALLDVAALGQYDSFTLSKGGIDENIAYLKELYTQIFPALPEHSLSISEFPASMTFKDALAYYVTPPVDDATKNVVKINPARCDDDPYILTTLAHETYGGHLLESVYQSTTNMGYLRRALSFAGFSEGWANYGARQMMLASDFHPTLTKYHLAYNDAMEYIYVRGIIGVQYEGWKADELMDHLLKYLNPEIASFKDELYQEFLSLRVNYISYAVGNIFFANLREKAEKALGSSFDAILFHEKILSIGAAQLHIVEGEIDKWIASFNQATLLNAA